MKFLGLKMEAKPITHLLLYCVIAFNAATVGLFVLHRGIINTFKPNGDQQVSEPMKSISVIFKLAPALVRALIIIGSYLKLETSQLLL